jgi:transposase
MLLSMRATKIELNNTEREKLQSLTRNGKTEQRMSLRAQIILLADEGKATQEIAETLSTRKATVSKWRTRFAAQRMEGLRDEPRPGKPATYDDDTEKRVLAVLDQDPPRGYATWNGRLVAEALGDVSKDQVWRILRQHRIQLQRRKSWCISTDPQFAAKAADIVGIYLDPPENALVISVDEKPQIQALERAQGYLKLPNGRALFGQSHGYKRHGTTTLFAAFDIATGQVKAGHYNRRRRLEFLHFMNSVIKDHPDKEIHVILDNLNTHKPKRDLWLKRHPNVHFHFTPTGASWLNQVEVWFSILSRAALKGASFTSPQQVRDAITNFIAVHNENAAPFQWRKRSVGPKGLKKRYSDLCN